MLSTLYFFLWIFIAIPQANIFVPIYHMGKLGTERLPKWLKLTQLEEVQKCFSARGLNDEWYNQPPVHPAFHLRLPPPCEGSMGHCSFRPKLFSGFSERKSQQRILPEHSSLRHNERSLCICTPSTDPMMPWKMSQCLTNMTIIHTWKQGQIKTQRKVLVV